MRTSTLTRSALCLALSLGALAATVDSSRPVAAAAGDQQTSGFYHPLTPARILDTREGLGASGRVGPDASVSVQVTGEGGVPASAVAVVMNVTVTEPTSSGFVTVHPHGADRPTASNLNFTAGQTVPNLVVAKLSGDGRLDFYNSHGRTHLVADVMGWFDGAATSSTVPKGASAQRGLRPTRLLDTRDAGRALAAGHEIELAVADVDGIPADATAVALNITVTEPRGPGFVTVYPHGTSRPTTSNLNYVTGQTVPNMTIAKVGVDGRIRIYSHSTTHVVVDAIAYFVPVDAQRVGALTPLVPARVMDTRTGSGAPQGPVGAGERVTLDVTGVGGVPERGVDSVVLNVTVTEPTDHGFVTVHPTGSKRPTASNLNFTPGQTVPNLVIAKVGSDGRVELYNSSGDTHLVVDVAGWFGSTPSIVPDPPVVDPPTDPNPPADPEPEPDPVPPPPPPPNLPPPPGASSPLALP